MIGSSAASSFRDHPAPHLLCYSCPALRLRFHSWDPQLKPVCRKFLSKDVRFGTAGWSYKDWEGVFYPSGMQHRKMHPLEYLARFFDTTEINTSFYGPIKAQLAKLWCRKVAAVNPRFLFTAKLYRAFTHSRRDGAPPPPPPSVPPTKMKPALAKASTSSPAKVAWARSSSSFLSRSRTLSLNREYLDRLLRQFIEYPRAVEVRDSSWDNPETLADLSHTSMSPSATSISPFSDGR